MKDAKIDCPVITYSANIVQIIDTAASNKDNRFEVMKDINKRTFTMTEEYKDKIFATALIDPRLGEEAINEMEATAGKSVGFSILSAYNIDGKIRFLDDPIYSELWSEASKLGRPVFIHFSNLYKINDPACALPGFMNDTLLHAGMGQLMENTLCITRLILSGLFDKYPNLKVVMGQLGGMLPFMLERFEILYSMYAQGAKSQGIEVTNPEIASHFLRNLRNYTDNIYADTHSMDSNSIRCAAESMGADKLLYGSDYPITPDKCGMGHGLSNIYNMDASETIKQAILGENAKKLLNI